MTQKKIHIDERKLQHQYGYRFIKRLFDVVASSVAVVILSPVFLIIAIAIKINDPAGPVFYTQTRVGKDGKPFKMFKFRSMVTNADELLERLRDQNEVEGAMFKMKDDPRITKVGKFIRKYSLDELPQLLNVVGGSMSIVGPRPPLPFEVEEYTDYDRQRLMVKPGATGMWQVGGRNALSFDQMVELDLTYINERSIWLDLKIMFETVKVMIKPNAAY
ncbi:sugar transferase [Limosilactobacillus vaginalis]|uniref:Bacterial sugar transferase n=1 Tax=Limosilactobacillus vaginalis DSM 5837 = ATCC 49540 TaxID=1423814 RepID=C2EVK0_9LACO|nr:sugar transferase [Limosilactobacillus vaginalis]EEJ40075.1 bacterial sugar transferase [Limosilactobacillus vaginalis DSM 5837 = ATCC 49540]KRM48349.1 sugar transferase [Limosilactobacillus vaginalis DSM 5837 = ATCC 49540]MDM8221682.1 sugar transferase [Limosilactobacillus vaginalis]MDM8244482.1 sugar transferase [Limosilactobacillus vaginalis]MDM8261062.1 sugar transferase [Limosilactobacillus vaginalis]